MNQGVIRAIIDAAELARLVDLDRYPIHRLDTPAGDALISDCRREMREVVRAALETLNERQKMALLLNKFEHMSYIDIAAAMDLSVSAVKSLLTRARALGGKPCRAAQALSPGERSAT